MRRATIVSVLSVLTVMLSTADLLAQPAATEVSDQVIRIRAGQQLVGTGQPVSIASRVGTLLQTRGDTLFLDPGDGQGVERFLLGEVTVVERRAPATAEHSGLLIGGFAGLVLGGVVTYAVTEPEYKQMCGSLGEALSAGFGLGECPLKETDHRRRRAAAGSLLGSLGGGALGWAIGRAIERHRWVAVSTDRVELAVGVEPVGEGLGPTVRIGF